MHAPCELMQELCKPEHGLLSLIRDSAAVQLKKRAVSAAKKQSTGLNKTELQAAFDKFLAKARYDKFVRRIALEHRDILVCLWPNISAPPAF